MQSVNALNTYIFVNIDLAHPFSADLKSHFPALKMQGRHLLAFQGTFKLFISLHIQNKCLCNISGSDIFCKMR